MRISVYGDYRELEDYNIGGYVDLEGRPVKKTPQSNPYDYDDYVIWKGNFDREKSHAVYSDRLVQWDTEKYHKCWKEVFDGEGIFSANNNPSKINLFLNKYFGKEVKLTAILQGCNVSSGFQYWVYYYEE